jgi:hypothetical protein
MVNRHFGEACFVNRLKNTIKTKLAISSETLVTIMDRLKAHFYELLD